MATGRTIDYPQPRVARVQWPSLDAGETGDAADIARWTEKTIQIGVDVGTSVIDLEGSNDGTNWSPLPDHADLEQGIYAIPESPLYIRPVVTAGDTDEIPVILIGIQV